MNENQEGLLNDKWIAAIPQDPYAPCPCGCGQKWRYVVKEGEEEIAKHQAQFEKQQQG